MIRFSLFRSFFFIDTLSFFFFCPLVHPAGLKQTSSGVQGSPVKRRGAGRWRLSEEGRRETTAQQEREAGCEESPLRSNRNPFSPDGEGRGTGDTRGENQVCCVCLTVVGLCARTIMVLLYTLKGSYFFIDKKKVVFCCGI